MHQNYCLILWDEGSEPPSVHYPSHMTQLIASCASLFFKLNGMTTLSQLLDPRAIALDQSAESWQDAVRAAGALLTDSGVATSAYTETMIATVEDKGPYIVIAPGFAFAHARPNEAVHNTGMSWLTLREPVAFGHPTNDPVSLVVALAATDDKQHTQAMAQLAKLLGNKRKRELLDAATTPEEVMRIIADAAPAQAAASTAASANATSQPPATGSTTRDKILTVCGNGLGTSLFLKNTLEEVLDHWGWQGLITVEATDTISAKGKAKEADLIMTSGEIARTLGDLGIPVCVIENFTSKAEIDHALRELYDLDSLA